MGVPAAILDVDGTLVDTNYHHAVAWFRAFRRHGETVPLWRIHRHMGMGGDQLVAALLGDEFEQRSGDAVRDAEKELYGELIDEVRPLPRSRELIEGLRERGHVIVLSSSAKQEEVDHYLELLDARELVHGWTTSADVDATKPQPDLIEAAVEKAGAERCVMVGDSTWDCIAASRAGLKTIGLLTGGFSREELLEEGAAVVYEDIGELIERLGDGPLG